MATTNEPVVETPAAPWELSPSHTGIYTRDHRLIAVVADPTSALLLVAAPELRDALAGMIGLIQLIERERPELQTNHRFIEAQRVLAKAEGLEWPPHRS